MSTEPVITLEVADRVALVLVDYPPVNALSNAVRQELHQALLATESDPEVDVVVLACKGRTFIAGADIREFGLPAHEPSLPDLIGKLEQANKPWVAALHGSALGGGLELALGCCYRVALASARFGLPEINLGLMPGAGGTVRLPRLVGPATALDIISSGKPVDAATALSIGLIDTVIDGELVEGAKRFARAILETGEHPQPLTLRPMPEPADPAAWRASLTTLRQRAGKRDAPKAIAVALENASTMDADTSLKEERELFLKLRDGQQSAALRYLFMAERSATRIDRLKTVAPLPVQSIGIVGGGTMGAGIAAACLLADLSVVMIEQNQEALEAGLSRVAATLDGSMKRKLIGEAQHQTMLGALQGSTHYQALSKADIIIEAVFEDMSIKRDVFKELDRVAKPDAVLASNTSYLDVNELACCVRDPSRVLGLHFFSPAHIMKLLEIVVTDEVSDTALATAFTLGKTLRKVTVPAGVCDGFIGNRIMSSYRRTCDELLEDGALPQQVDAAMEAFGFAMGIYRVQDMAGLDISWAMRKRQAATRDSSARYVDIADALCEQGRFGIKAGLGWYRYEAGKAIPDPDVQAIIVNASRRSNITRRALSDQFIMECVIGAMQEEGQKVLHEGIAGSPEAIDVVMVNGYGFPRWRGGPMYLLDHPKAGM